MMLTHSRNSISLFCVACWGTLLVLLWSPATFAQSGLYVVPWLTVEEVYDDNIFFDTEDEVSDFYTRLSPRLDVGFESETLSWLLSFQNDAEWYNDLSQLDSNSARQFGLGTINYDLNRRWTLNGEFQYISTNSAEDITLNPGGGIPGSVGRQEAERLLLSGGADYEFTPNLSGGLDITWTRDDLIGSNQNEVLAATTQFEQILSPARTLLYGYEYRNYDFQSETGTDPVITETFSEDSNTAWLGLTQSLSETSTLELRAGPRFSDGDVEPYFLFGWQREYARGNVAIEALWDETTLLGENGILESRSVLVTWAHEFSADLEINSSAGYAYLTETGFSSDITYFNVSGIYRFSPAIEMTARYGFNAQLDDGSSVTSGRITHNVLSISITFTRPRRDA